MSSDATYVGFSGVDAAQQRLEIIANNVANSSTAGYRRDQTIFDTVLGGKMPFAHVAGTQLDLSPGSHQMTKNPLNAAIDGKGFFVVQDADGNEAYTRRGDFELNAQKELVLPNGMRVMGKGGTISVPAGTHPVIQNDGSITTEHGRIGQLRIVEFEDPSQLAKAGGSLITAGPDAGLQDVPYGRVAGGFVEMS